MIYVLTEGEYSSYHIITATTNKEIAEAFAKVRNCEIEEIEDFQDFTVINQARDMSKAFYFRFDQKGNIEECCERFVSKDSHLSKDVLFNYNFVTEVKADSKEKAEKIARDRRAKALAEYFNM